MNMKSILYKGLPILLIGVIVVVVAVVLSRPQPQPEVSNQNEVVLEFNDLVITKADFYNLLKFSKNESSGYLTSGLSSLLNLIDKEVLAQYAESIDDEDLDKQIQDDIDALGGKDKFYEYMIYLNVIESKDDVDRDEKIKEYYELEGLRRAYAKQVATDEITEKEIQNARNNYKEMYCVIPVKFGKHADALAFKAQLEAVKDDKEAVKALFEAKWREAQDDDEDEDEEEEEEELPDFIESFECNYEKYTYENISSTALRDFVYSDIFQNVGDFNLEEKRISDNYYFIYLAGKPIYVEENFRDSTKFIDYITNQLIENKLTLTYITNKIEELHNKINLKIYDTKIGAEFKTIYDKKFEPEKKLNKTNKSIVATFQYNGKSGSITADNLYNEMKSRYTLMVLFDKISYEALKSIEGIQLTKSDIKTIEKQIANLKTEYLNLAQVQALNLNWREFISYYYGAYSDNDLIKNIALPKLLERYQFGYKDFTGVSTVTDEDVAKRFAERFRITASHIFFEFDPEDDESKAKALAKADQILKGCTDNGDRREGVTECYIFYDYNVKDKDENDPVDEFVGLDEVNSKDYSTVFSDLAKKYSTDTNSGKSGGSLGQIKQGQMVKEFEEALLAITNNGKSDPNMPFNVNYLPIESTIEREDRTIHGYHVIYVTAVDKKPEELSESEKERYEQYLEDKEDGDTSDYTTAEKTRFDNYKKYIDTVKDELTAERKTSDYQNKLMAEFQKSFLNEIKFKDTDMQKHYSNYLEYMTQQEETEE
ncbi:MAG TPA: peptidylprolyl isomerase [Haloplasmataceae bacterium]